MHSIGNKMINNRLQFTKKNKQKLIHSQSQKYLYNGAKYGEIDLNIYIKNIVTSCLVRMRT